ncbi:hypothetical protein LY78DRAFT_17164 [Colletotrichum sublineola]|nr:hypothetical protein LY78DRAFT_17164 [Colletotrichum sublineola]
MDGRAAQAFSWPGACLASFLTISFSGFTVSVSEGMPGGRSNASLANITPRADWKSCDMLQPVAPCYWWSVHSHHQASRFKDATKCSKLQMTSPKEEARPTSSGSERQFGQGSRYT